MTEGLVIGLRARTDTDILLDATDEGRAWHQKARSIFRELPLQGGDLFLATQVVREYLVVAARPMKNNGLGLSIEDAVANIEQFRKRTSLISETVPASDLLLRWAPQLRIVGKNLHDLQLLATVQQAGLQAGLQALLTSNPGDFPGEAGLRIYSLPDLEIAT